MTRGASETLRVVRAYAAGHVGLLLLVVTPLGVVGPESAVVALVAVAIAVAMSRLADGSWVTALGRGPLPQSTAGETGPAPATLLLDPPVFPVRPRAPGLV